MNEVFDLLTERLRGPSPIRRCPAPYALLEVWGPDAMDFLHRLCSQDVAAMQEGTTAPAAFLDAKGKLITTVLLARGRDGVAVEVQRSMLEALHRQLDRLHFGERLELRRRDDWTCAEVVGSTAWDPGPGDNARFLADGLELIDRRRGLHRARRHGPAAALTAWRADCAVADPGWWEALRIASGEPCIGVDTEPTTLALELDIADHLSLTKGCYTGQEIVARIHTYGHVNRRLVRLIVETTESIPVGTPLVASGDGSAVGRLMSSARIPGVDRTVAFGFLPGAFLDEPEPLAMARADGPSAHVVGS